MDLCSIRALRAPIVSDSAGSAKHRRQAGFGLRLDRLRRLHAMWACMHRLRRQRRRRKARPAPPLSRHHSICPAQSFSSPHAPKAVTGGPLLASRRAAACTYRDCSCPGSTWGIAAEVFGQSSLAKDGVQALRITATASWSTTRGGPPGGTTARSRYTTITHRLVPRSGQTLVRRCFVRSTNNAVSAFSRPCMRNDGCPEHS